MSKKFLNLFNIMFLGIFSCNIYAEFDDEGTRAKEIRDENEYLEDLGLNYMSIGHPPIFIEEEGFKSVLIFLKNNLKNEILKEGVKDNKQVIPFGYHIFDGSIYQIRLSDKKMQFVGPIFGEEILSVFTHRNKENHDRSVYVLSKTKINDETHDYNIYEYRIIKEKAGLFIHWFPTEPTIIQFDHCYDGGLDYFGEPQVCPFKDAASIKRFLDGERIKQ